MFNFALAIYVIVVLLFLGTAKQILFWIYLWQLKDYHIGRFLDHFRTAKGKRIIFSYFTQFFFWRVKRPVFTVKAKLITGLALLDVAGYYWVIINNTDSAFVTVAALAAYNFFTPLIVSAIILIIQPFFVLARHGILAKAKTKLAGHKNITVIAITGSYGKTSTKEFLTTILSSKFKVLATPEHKNSEMGIAQTILQDLRPEHNIFIVEMGAYNKGGIDLLCRMVKPDMGIVTGVNEQHLATFGSLENLLSAEGGRELAAQLPGHGILVINGENAHCLNLYKHFKGNKRLYASRANTIDADVWAEDIAVTKEGLDFMLVSRQKQTAHVAANVLGAHNIQNVLGAALVAKELGMTLEEISVACRNIKPAQAGITLKTGAHGILVIDSSYSSNPDGVAADLNYLAIFPGKKVLVMPCLIELGNESARIHEELGKKIAQICDVAIITTKDKFKELSAGFMDQGASQRKILLCDNPHEIFNMITTMCKQGDAVLLEGGRPKELIRLLDGK